MNTVQTIPLPNLALFMRYEESPAFLTEACISRVMKGEQNKIKTNERLMAIAKRLPIQLMEKPLDRDSSRQGGL